MSPRSNSRRSATHSRCFSSISRPRARTGVNWATDYESRIIPTAPDSRLVTMPATSSYHCRRRLNKSRHRPPIRGRRHRIGRRFHQSMKRGQPLAVLRSTHGAANLASRHQIVPRCPRGARRRFKCKTTRVVSTSISVGG